MPDRCNSNFLVDQPQIYRIMSCIDTVFQMLQSQVFGQDNILQEGSQDPSSGTAPSCLPDVMHVTLSPRPSPSVFSYCKRSKAGGGNSLGTRIASMYYTEQERIRTGN